MTRSQATPCSSQLIWAEGRIAELEEGLEDLTAKLEKSRQYHRLMELEKENFRINQQLVECQAREAKLRKALNDTYASVPPYTIKPEVFAQAAEAARFRDDTALREYAEDHLNNSPEVALLNKIGRLLEDVDYKGDYADGIRALVEQKRKQGILDVAERLNHIMAGAGIWRELVEAELRKMAEEA